MRYEIRAKSTGAIETEEEGSYLLGMYADRMTRLEFVPRRGRNGSLITRAFAFDVEEVRNLVRDLGQLLEAVDDFPCPGECGSTVIRDGSTPTGYRVICGDGCHVCGPGVPDEDEATPLPQDADALS